MIMSDVETIEISMEQAKAKIKRLETLERLHANPDFKELFLEGYMKDFAAEMVARKASLGAQEEKNQKFIDNQITAIGHVGLYMNLLAQEGRVARETLAADEQELGRALEEEA
jgi:hypothetical protein